MVNKQKLLSVVIPAYKQEKTIQSDIKRIASVLEKIRYDYEIVLVVDGDIDNTYKKAKELKNPKLKVFLYEQNHGKGYAIRYGMGKAEGDYVAFIDSGEEIDPNGISMVLEHLEWYDADVIVGSKRHPASQVNYPLIRKILSFGYYRLVKLLFGLKVRDTQAGIKIYRREVLERIRNLLLVKKYAFDIELLAVAKQFGYHKIYEAPIKLDYNFSSLTSAASLRTIINMLKDTLAVFYRINILNYYKKLDQTLEKGD